MCHHKFFRENRPQHNYWLTIIESECWWLGATDLGIDIASQLLQIWLYSVESPITQKWIPLEPLSSLCSYIRKHREALSISFIIKTTVTVITKFFGQSDADANYAMNQSELKTNTSYKWLSSLMFLKVWFSFYFFLTL